MNRLRWAGTVRARVTLLAALAVTMVLVATAAAVVVIQRRVLTDQLDETLAADADREITSMGTTGRPALDPSADDEAVVQILTVDGTVVAATGGFTAGGPIAPTPEGSNRVFRTIDGPGERTGPYRVTSRPFEAGGRRLVVHVAAPLDDVGDAVSALLITLAFILPAVTVMLAGLVWLLVGRALGPVERIRAEVAGIGFGQLDRRVPQPAGGDEIARLAATMNQMLDRLDRSARQQQRFVADASHELRTPLSRLRTELDVAQRTGSPDPAAGELLASLVEEVDNLQRLTDDLLVLARVDAGLPAADGRLLDLDDVVLEAARSMHPPGIAVNVRQVSAAQVVGHRDQLHRVVSNLLDNAIRHATREITVTLSERDGAVTLTVTDDGPGIPPERHADIFERFRRVDDARTAGRGGTGLGLAIARDLVEGHGGTISVDADHQAGARFVVTVPTNS
jgi:signal transduction histidine kinase